MSDDKGNNKNPIQRLWNFISVIGGIVGISSLAENWVEDLIKWKGWIAAVIESYQGTVYPLSEWLLGWLPWTLSSWLVDYFVLGIIFISSVAKGLVPPENMSFRAKLSDTRCSDILLFLIFYLTQLIIWPYIFFLIVRNYIFERESDFQNVLIWFCTIILGFIILLSINTAL